MIQEKVIALSVGYRIVSVGGLFSKKGAPATSDGQSCGTAITTDFAWSGGIV
jgi:hypothetical protein